MSHGKARHVPEETERQRALIFSDCKSKNANEPDLAHDRILQLMRRSMKNPEAIVESWKIRTKEPLTAVA